MRDVDVVGATPVERAAVHDLLPLLRPGPGIDRVAFSRGPAAGAAAARSPSRRRSATGVARRACSPGTSSRGSGIAAKRSRLRVHGTAGRWRPGGFAPTSRGRARRGRRQGNRGAARSTCARQPDRLPDRGRRGLAPARRAGDAGRPARGLARRRPATRQRTTSPVPRRAGARTGRGSTTAGRARAPGLRRPVHRRSSGHGAPGRTSPHRRPWPSTSRCRPGRPRSRHPPLCTGRTASVRRHRTSPRCATRSCSTGTGCCSRCRPGRLRGAAATRR